MKIRTQWRASEDDTRVNEGDRTLTPPTTFDCTQALLALRSLANQQLSGQRGFVISTLETIGTLRDDLSCGNSQDNSTGRQFDTAEIAALSVTEKAHQTGYAGAATAAAPLLIESRVRFLLGRDHSTK